jgi:DnaK suppressor protein
MDKKRSIKSNLTPAEKRKFKAILLARRNEILGNMTCMEAEALRRQRSDLSILPIHMADLGTDNNEIENTLGLVDSERKLLAEVDDALQRIEDGTYGICEGTGMPIPKERLEAIPWARYCVEYASLLEKGFVKKRYSFDESDYNGETDDDDHAPEQPYRRIKNP